MAAARTGIPSFGRVIWKDATAFTGKTSIKKMSRALPLVASVGRLFLAADGTLAVFHQYFEVMGMFQRDVEATFIPVGWVTQIIPLTEPDETPKKVEGTDAG